MGSALRAHSVAGAAVPLSLQSCRKAADTLGDTENAVMVGEGGGRHPGEQRRQEPPPPPRMRAPLEHLPATPPLGPAAPLTPALGLGTHSRGACSHPSQDAGAGAISAAPSTGNPRGGARVRSRVPWDLCVSRRFNVATGALGPAGDPVPLAAPPTALWVQGVALHQAMTLSSTPGGITAEL